MKQYLSILQNVLENGVWRDNRTIYRDKFIPSACFQHDLRQGFPLLTSKQVFYKQSFGEILGFIRGYENAKDFAKLGCKFWYSDANENKTWLRSPFRKGENDLGRVYGSIWRYRNGCKVFGFPPDEKQESYLFNNRWKRRAANVWTKRYDQLFDVLDDIINNPTSRRIILHAWFPESFDEMALPPCHVLYQFIPDVENKVLHLSMYQRSCDLFLGVPMNICGSSLLLSLIAKATGYTPGVFSHHMSNVHLYENQIDAAWEQLKSSRTPYPSLPKLKIIKQADESIVSNPYAALTWLEFVRPDDLIIEGYKHHPPLAGIGMAQEK